MCFISISYYLLSITFLMSLLLGILLAVFVFLLVVLVHEFGHFFTARLTGMKVLEFWFGLPPKMIRVFQDKKWTEYTWNWLPIWGFVRILGEDPTGEDAHKEWSFMTRPWLYRVIVLIAWVTMNFILAFVIFTWLFISGTSPVAVNPFSDRPTNSFFIPSFDEAVEMGYVKHSGLSISALTWSIAESAWIGSDEKVLQINQIPVADIEEFIDTIKDNTTIELLLEKNAITRTIILQPDNGKIWVRLWYIDMKIDEDYLLDLDLYSASIMGVRETYNSSILTLVFLRDLIHGVFVPDTPEERELAKNMLAWPIGVGATFVWLVEASASIGLIFVIIALISINLGVVNLLPIPALDGGRIVTTTLYSMIVRFFHSWIDRFLQFEKYFHTFGFILLMILTIYIAWLDISRFF